MVISLSEAVAMRLAHTIEQLIAAVHADGSRPKMVVFLPVLRELVAEVRMPVDGQADIVPFRPRRQPVHTEPDPEPPVAA